MLEVLADLFGSVLVPPAVAAELKRASGNLPRIDIGEYAFIQVQTPLDRLKCAELQKILDPGESEALTLAIELQAEAVLIDEAAGREWAIRLGLSPVGVLGILLKAKGRGNITEIRPFIDELRDELNFFISQDLYAGVLRLANEAT